MKIAYPTPDWKLNASNRWVADIHPYQLVVVPAQGGKWTAHFNGYGISTTGRSFVFTDVDEAKAMLTERLHERVDREIRDAQAVLAKYMRD